MLNVWWLNNMEDKILLVVVAYNEEGKVGKVLSFIPECVDEVLVVDDGSTDGTAEEARQFDVTVISHEKNRDVGAAIRTGIDYAIKNNFNICAIISGDNQYKQSEVCDLVKPITEEDYDFVYSSRYLTNEIQKQPLFRKLTTIAYTWLFKFVTGVEVSDTSNGFRAFKTEIFKDINIWQDWLDRYEMEPYILIEVLKRNYKFKQVPCTKSFPKEGYSKMKPFEDWYRICKPLFRELINKIKGR